MKTNLKITPARKHNSIVAMGFCITFGNELDDLDSFHKKMLNKGSFASTFFPYAAIRTDVVDGEKQLVLLVYTSSEDAPDSDWAMCISKDSLWIYHNDYRRWKYSYEVCKNTILDIKDLFCDRSVVSIFLGYYDVFNIVVDKSTSLQGVKIPGVLFRNSEHIPPIVFDKNLASFSTSFFNDVYTSNSMEIVESVSVNSETKPQTIEDDSKFKYSVSIDTQVHSIFHKGPIPLDTLLHGDAPLDAIAQKTHDTSKALFCSMIGSAWLETVGISAEEERNARS